MSRSFAANAAGRVQFSTDPFDAVGLLQPHGIVLVVREPDCRIVQASAHAGAWLGEPLETILLGSVDRLGGDLHTHLRRLAAPDTALAGGAVLARRCTIGTAGAVRLVEAWVHRPAPDVLTVELLLPTAEPGLPAGTATAEGDLLAHLEDAIHGLSQANTIEELAAQAVRHVQTLCGHEEVRIVRLGPDGSAGLVCSSAAAAAGTHPALTGRWPVELHAAGDGFPWSLDGAGVDVLVDALADPVGLLPHRQPGSADDPQDLQALARSTLRSPSPARLARLRQAGVRAEARAGLLREGKPWGVITCLDGKGPRPLPAAHRFAFALLAEAVATRITAIESAGRAEVAEQVRRLQGMLVEAATQEGDWRSALLRAPQLLLQPLQANGAALLHAGDSLCCGTVPVAEDMQAIAAWLGAHVADSVWHSVDLAAEDAALARRVPAGTGVLAAKLSVRQPDYLVWFRRPGAPEQSAALPWSATDLARAASFAEMLVDLMVQVDAVRLLIAGRQLQQLQAKVADSREAVVVCDAQGTVTLVNEAFAELTGRAQGSCGTLDQLIALFTPTAVARRLSAQVRAEQRPARSVLAVARPDGTVLPVAVRAEPVLARSGALMGMIFLVEDLTSARLAEAAWTQLQDLLGTPTGGASSHDAHPVVSAIRTHASLAAMDMADTTRTPGLAPLLQEVESATQRAIGLYWQLIGSLQRGQPPT